MRSIFISYRRDDSEGEAGRLFDDLIKQFSPDAVFMDVSAIEAGSDFRKAIEESIASCGVVLVIIGPEWLDAKGENGERRLDDEADFVRIETASALKRDIPVIPVLVRGAKMPRPDQLPPDLTDLAYRNAVELTHTRWRSDVQLLMKALRPLIGVPAAGSNESAKHQSGGTPTSGNVDPETLRRIARELAVHIGPIADIVVKRSAARCASIDDLCRAVAQEIESPVERERFLAAVLPHS